MARNRGSFFFLIMVGVLGLLGEVQAADPLRVFVSLPPQKFFVERLGGDRVKVEALVPAGADPHTFEPSPAQMKALSQASLYFAIGVPFEKTLVSRIRSINPQLTVIQTDQDLPKRFMVPHSHGHGDEGKDQKSGEKGKPKAQGQGVESATHSESHDHDHGEPDPHVWLSPPLVMAMARTMALALMEADPSDRAGYEGRYKTFLAEVAALDLEIHRILREAKPPRIFYVFHPSWGYFADAYGLEQVSVESEGKEAKPAHLKALIQSARQAGVKVLFVQPQFSSRSAEMVAKEIGATLEVLDPLAENWMENLRQVTRRLREAMP